MDILLSKLEDYLRSLKKVAIAFSGGVDSSFLVFISKKVLDKNNILPIFVESEFTLRREKKGIKELSKAIGISPLILRFSILGDPKLKENPKNRCYFCKRFIFSKIKEIANKKGYPFVLEATHAEDENYYRPGLKAIEELKIISPLKDLGITKKEIRRWSEEFNIPTYNKASESCIATRISYGIEISNELLQRIDKGEEFLLSLGFYPVRLRYHHNNLVRIEIPSHQIHLIIKEDIRNKIIKELKRLGFNYISFDMEGFRSGSMDEVN